MEKDLSLTKALRREFPALAYHTYFNYGGQGPLPRVAREAILAAFGRLDELGPFSNAVNPWVADQTRLTRQVMAQELGVDWQTITLTENVTAGCNTVLWGLPWQAGDHLLMSDSEHPGVIATVLELQRRYGISISRFPASQEDGWQTLGHYLQPNTRLVVLSHVLWNTGQVIPLPALPPLGKTLILVDGAQSVGDLPLQLTELNADFYAFTGHKWWCGPAGVGGLYVHPQALEQLQPTFIGWRSVTMDGAGEPTGWQPDGRRFEVATSSIPLYAGLRAAITLHQGVGGSRYRQIRHLSQYLWEGLQSLPNYRCLLSRPPESGLICFRYHPNPSPQIHQHLVEFLEREKILIRQLASPSCVRACVHYFTLPEEIDLLLDRLRAFPPV